MNNELGITRYIGSVDFASGVWLGVELRKPSKFASIARSVSIPMF